MFADNHNNNNNNHNNHNHHNYNLKDIIICTFGLNIKHSVKIGSKLNQDFCKKTQVKF